MPTDKKERLITPVGEARYPHLSTPRRYMENGKEKGDPKYSLQVIFSGTDPEWMTWATAMTAKVNNLPTKMADTVPPVPMRKKSPIKRVLDEDNKPTDKYVVSFSTGAQYRPDVVDQYGREIPPSIEVGSGSRVCVAYVENKHDKDGGGISLYLNGVQVIELQEYRGDAAGRHGFTVKPLPAGEPSSIPAPPEAPTAGSAPAPVPEDDLQF